MAAHNSVIQRIQAYHEFNEDINELLAVNAVHTSCVEL